MEVKNKYMKKTQRTNPETPMRKKFKTETLYKTPLTDNAVCEPTVEPLNKIVRLPLKKLSENYGLLHWLLTYFLI